MKSSTKPNTSIKAKSCYTGFSTGDAPCPQVTYKTKMKITKSRPPWNLNTNIWCKIKKMNDAAPFDKPPLQPVGIYKHRFTNTRTLTYSKRCPSKKKLTMIHTSILITLFIRLYTVHGLTISTMPDL